MFQEQRENILTKMNRLSKMCVTMLTDVIRLLGGQNKMERWGRKIIQQVKIVQYALTLIQENLISDLSTLLNQGVVRPVVQHW